MPNTKHPPFIAFLKHEKSTLQWLVGNSYISSHFRDLMIAAKNTLASFPSKDTHFKTYDFSFSCSLELTVENRPTCVVIETLIQPNFAVATYCLSIIEPTAEGPQLIRKFHFDYAMPIKNDPHPKPVYHIQYGGKSTNHLRNMGVDVTRLQPWLSSPRLNCAPINLALFLDIIFCEFRDQLTIGLIERSEWRDLVKKNESNLLKPYFENLSRFWGNQHSSDYLLREFYYGVQRQ